METYLLFDGLSRKFSYEYGNWYFEIVFSFNIRLLLKMSRLSSTGLGSKTSLSVKMSTLSLFLFFLMKLNSAIFI